MVLLVLRTCQQNCSNTSNHLPEPLLQNFLISPLTHSELPSWKRTSACPLATHNPDTLAPFILQTCFHHVPANLYGQYLTIDVWAPPPFPQIQCWNGILSFRICISAYANHGQYLSIDVLAPLPHWIWGGDRFQWKRIWGRCMLTQDSIFRL